MYCPQCGVALPIPAPRFCPSCGADLAPGAPLTAIARPGVVTFLAVLQFLGGAVNALGGVLLVALAAWADDRSMQSVLGLVGAGVLAIAAVQFVCGAGLWKLKPYGRTIQIVLASIGLIGFPIGTVIGVLMLVYLMKPGVKLLFSGRPPAGFSADEQRQIGELYGSRGLVIVAVAVAAGFAIVWCHRRGHRHSGPAARAYGGQRDASDPAVAPAAVGRSGLRRADRRCVRRARLPRGSCRLHPRVRRRSVRRPISVRVCVSGGL